MRPEASLTSRPDWNERALMMAIEPPARAPCRLRHRRPPAALDPCAIARLRAISVKPAGCPCDGIRRLELAAPAHELSRFTLDRLEAAARFSTRSPRGRASPPRCWSGWRSSPTCRASSRCRPSTAPRSSTPSPRAPCWSAAISSTRRYVGERFAFRPIGIYWLQMASGELLGSGAWGAIATYRLPSLLARRSRRARRVVAVAAAARRSRLAHRRGAVRRDAHRGAAGDAVDPRGPAAAGDRRRAAARCCASIATRATTATRAVARAGLLGGAGLRHAAERARRSDSVARDDRRALRLRPPPRLAEAPAAAVRRAADARHRRAVDPHPRALRRRRAVLAGSRGASSSARSAARRT